MSAEDLSRWKDGKIGRNDCIEHVHLEWECDCRPLVCSRVRSVDSPLFSVGDQTYALSFDSCDRYRVFEIFLHLYRKGPSVDIWPVRYWVGVKFSDGTYLYKNAFGKLPLHREFSTMEEMETLLRIETLDFVKEHETTDDQLTVCFQMEWASTNSQPCTHDSAVKIFPAEDGQICEDRFPCHTIVEWSVVYDPNRQKFWTSRAFSVGERFYRFVITRKTETTDFFLYRLGPSVVGPTTFYASLKRCDGIDHHNTTTGILRQQDFFELWSKQALLAYFVDDIFTRYHLSQEGRFTFVFRMDVGDGEQECKHDISKNIHWYHGDIQEKECSSHKHVEWRGVDFFLVLYNHPSKWISPVFSIEGQYYALTLSYHECDHYNFHLELLRKGPSVTGPPVRWWAGLKFKDGTYDYRNTFGDLKLDEKLSELTVVERLLTRQAESLGRYLQSDRRITAFFQLKIEHESTTAETCTHGTREISYRFDGKLDRNDCASHNRVKWNVEETYYRPFDTVFSQSFEIANQHYMLEVSHVLGDEVLLLLYRRGPSCAIDDPSGYQQWWVGMECKDGTHDNRNECGDLNLDETFSMWTEAKQLMRMDCLEFQRYFGGFTVVFQINVGQASTRAGTCSHDFLWMSTPEDGTIYVNRCTSHIRVDWNFKIAESGTRALSTVFEIGNQRYLLELSQESEVTFNLYRMGPSLDHSTGSIRWWAGLKRRDGNYDHKMNKSGNLNQATAFWMWAKAEQFLTIDEDAFPSYIAKDSGVALFFQMNVEEGSTTREECSHDSAEKIFPPSEGEITLPECNSNQHREWKLRYDERKKTWTSLAFDIGDQHYRFLFSTEHSQGTFHLYRLGPSVDDLSTPVQWSAGLKRCDANYQYRNESGELRTQEECEFWSEVALLSVVELHDFQKYLDKNNCFTFFFLVNHMTGAKACSHDRSDLFPVKFGSISEKNWTSYKLLNWDVDINVSNDVKQDIASSVFAFNNQKYVLELVFPESRYLSLHLSRMGPPDDRSLQWWAGIRYRGNTFQEFCSENGKLSLKVACGFWTDQNEIYSFTIPAEAGIMHLTVDVLMSLAAEECNNAEDQAPQDDLSKDDIVYIVKGERFQIPKALICFEAPVLGVLFQYANLESGQSEVHIVDCEPEVFGEFLQLLKGGFRETPTEENTFDLYTLADKYLLHNVKEKCLRHMRAYISADTFRQVARFCFRYENKDLLYSLATFLRENGEIINSERFVNLKTENPKEVDELLAKTFPPTN